MAILTLFSVAGAPGVTTTALALTLTSPRPTVLVDADPTANKAVLAGYLQGQSPHGPCLVDLAIAHHNGELADSLPAVMMQLPDSQHRFIPGIKWPHQASSITPLWPALIEAFDDLDDSGVDVIIDAGRLSAQHAPTAAIANADTTLLVTRTTLPPVVAAAAWLPTIRELVSQSARSTLGMTVIGDGHPYGAKEISDRLGGNLPVMANIALDPVTAEVFALGHKPGRHFNSSPLVRSARAASESLHSSLAARRTTLRAAEEEPTDE